MENCSPKRCSKRKSTVFKKVFENYWPVIVAIFLYSLLVNHLNFTQDDAYISYRYVANYLNGDGLVYNIGERIEGFTNFGWVIFMIFWGALGVGYIFISKLIGFLCGAAIIFVTYLIARKAFDGHVLYSGICAIIVGINQSHAYWAAAGLETAAFALVVVLAVYLFLCRSWWLIYVLVLAVWLRPEGALITGLLIGVELFQEKRVPKFTLTVAAIAFVLSLPYVIFKIFYYGSILPNPFYAKTGFNMEILSSGLEYTGRFFKHYGFYGAGFVLALISFKKLSRPVQAIFGFAVLYLIYIVLVGGDVLKVHRFFLPLFGLSAIVAIAGLRSILTRLSPKSEFMLLVIAGVGLVTLTYFLPKDNVAYFHRYETGFTKRMQWMANNLKQSDSTDFSIALPTIGIIGYELVGHRVIDMVGLTDSTIARHSEEPVEGMATTWKETKHNSKYLLSSAPDYILFSTGNKPSAPAERALLLFRQFHHSYRTTGWFYRSDTTRPQGVMSNIFKRVRPIEGALVPTYPVEFVEAFKRGLDNYVNRDFNASLRQFVAAIRASPKPYYPDLLYQTAFCYLQTQQHEKAVSLLSQVLAQDSLVYEAHRSLYLYARLGNDDLKADLHKRWIQKLVPWYWPIVEKDTEATVKTTMERARQQKRN